MSDLTIICYNRDGELNARMALMHHVVTNAELGYARTFTHCMTTLSTSAMVLIYWLPKHPEWRIHGRLSETASQLHARPTRYRKGIWTVQTGLGHGDKTDTLTVNVSQSVQQTN